MYEFDRQQDASLCRYEDTVGLLGREAIMTCPRAPAVLGKCRIKRTRPVSPVPTRRNGVARLVQAPPAVMSRSRCGGAPAARGLRSPVRGRRQVCGSLATRSARACSDASGLVLAAGRAWDHSRGPGCPCAWCPCCDWPRPRSCAQPSPTSIRRHCVCDHCVALYRPPAAGTATRADVETSRMARSEWASSAIVAV